MAGVLNILSKLFGNKYDKDVKKISPIIENGAHVIIGVRELGRMCLNITCQLDAPRDTAADT